MLQLQIIIRERTVINTKTKKNGRISLHIKYDRLLTTLTISVSRSFEFAVVFFLLLELGAVAE